MSEYKHLIYHEPTTRRLMPKNNFRLDVLHPITKDILFSEVYPTLRELANHLGVTYKVAQKYKRPKKHHPYRITKLIGYSLGNRN